MSTADCNHDNHERIRKYDNGNCSLLCAGCRWIVGFWEPTENPRSFKYTEYNGRIVIRTEGPETVRPSWDEWGIGLAQAASERADCTRRQVGAVVLDVNNRVVGVGYNGAPSGDPGCLTAGACPRGQQNKVQVTPGSSYDTGLGSCIAIHAEQNALLDADPVRRRGGTLYVSCEPCDGCWRMIKGAGIARVVWPEGHRTLL